MARKCSPPRTQSVKSHWRAARRKKPKAKGDYYVAEDERGHTCGHHHRTLTSGMACARRMNRKAHRKQGRKGATYVTEKKGR